jgi:hypothetical protein
MPRLVVPQLRSLSASAALLAPVVRRSRCGSSAIAPLGRLFPGPRRLSPPLLRQLAPRALRPAAPSAAHAGQLTPPAHTGCLAPCCAVRLRNVKGSGFAAPRRVASPAPSPSPSPGRRIAGLRGSSSHRRIAVSPCRRVAARVGEGPSPVYAAVRWRIPLALRAPRASPLGLPLFPRVGFFGGAGCPFNCETQPAPPKKLRAEGRGGASGRV